MKIEPLNEHTRATFVRANVKEIPLTTKIIDEVMPYFPKKCLCISGFLDDADQFWKVNYHWDLLLSKVEEILGMKTVSAALKLDAEAIRTQLLANSPNPARGYRSDKIVGATKDSSSRDKITARHAIVKQAKIDFEKVITGAGVATASAKASPPAGEKMWWLAVAPLAKPGKSTHGTGFALDIAGEKMNLEISRICKGLGGTMAFNEASHVHCEWGQGVKLPG